MSKAPKVTINPGIVETPSQAIIRSANKTATVTDSLGRVLTVRRLSPVIQQRLRAIAGPDLSRNQEWFGWAALAFSVSAINGDPVIANSQRELEVLTEQLDEEGLVAVSSCIIENWGKVNEPENMDVVKN